MREPTRLTPAARDALRRISAATDRTGAWLSLVALAESRGLLRVCDRLLSAGYVERCKHPTIQAAGGDAAPALRITEAGRAALAATGR